MSEMFVFDENGMLVAAHPAEQESERSVGEEPDVRLDTGWSMHGFDEKSLRSGERMCLKGYRDFADYCMEDGTLRDMLVSDQGYRAANDIQERLRGVLDRTYEVMKRECVHHRLPEAVEISEYSAYITGEERAGSVVISEMEAGGVSREALSRIREEMGFTMNESVINVAEELAMAARAERVQRQEGWQQSLQAGKRR